jgi:glutathionyl-hydroquinone reductase
MIVSTTDTIIFPCPLVHWASGASIPQRGDDAMGRLIDGRWSDDCYDAEKTGAASVVYPFMGKDGWSLGNPDDTAGVTGDTLLGKDHLHQVYTEADPCYATIVNDGVHRCGFATTQQPYDEVSFEHIKRHYYESHATINPTGVVPVGPSLDLARPHGRDAIGGDR